MNCKNCATPFQKNASFCDNCGAKIVRERITTKLIILQLLESFGWESAYFKTLKKMFSKPYIVLEEYLNGTRKRYMKPFSYLIIGTAIYLTILNFFKDDFNAIQNAMVQTQIEATTKDLSEINTLTIEEQNALKAQQKSAEFGLKMSAYILKYFNIVALLFIPLFSFISKFTYKKPYNYGEHMVMNTYLYGSAMYISILFFFLAKFIHLKIYFFTNLAFIIFYAYTFSKLYKHTLKQTVMKLLRFMLITIITGIIFIFLLSLLFIFIKIVFPNTIN